MALPLRRPEPASGYLYTYHTQVHHPMLFVFAAAFRGTGAERKLWSDGSDYGIGMDTG